MVGVPRFLLIFVSGLVYMPRLVLVIGRELFLGFGLKWRRRHLFFVLRAVGAEFVH